MLAITLHEAKAQLNKLVDKAQQGEQVVLMRGSKIVATIVPLSEEDVEIIPSLADAQAESFWAQIETDDTKTFPTMDKALTHLKKI